jgi:hypothetical protein
MSDYADCETMPIDQFRPILTKLALLLENLPAELPLHSGSESRYAIFMQFSLDPALLEKTDCECSALTSKWTAEADFWVTS